MRIKLFVIGLVFFTFPRISAGAGYTAKEWEALKTGEVIATEVFTVNPDGSQATDVLVKAWVKAPREAVWRVIRDYNKFSEFMPKVIRCRITKQEGETFWVCYETEVLSIRVVYTLTVRGVDKFRRIEFDLDSSRPNDIKGCRGYWILDDAPDGQGTVLSYSAFVDTGIPAPEFLTRRISKPNLVQVVKNARRRAESGGTWKKPAGS